MGPDVRHSCFIDLTDVTLADEDTNSLPSDESKRVQSLAKQVQPPGGQTCNVFCLFFSPSLDWLYIIISLRYIALHGLFGKS